MREKNIRISFMYRVTQLLSITILLVLLNGCLSRGQRVEPNYYILDYSSVNENPGLRMQKPFPYNLEVVSTSVPRTYNRNQIVVKEHFSKIKYLPQDLWATRLHDAIPNLLVQRFKAYNIFQRVDRELGEIVPDFYLETNVLNIEMIEDNIPIAFIRMEFFLRESVSQKIVLSYQNESSKPIRDKSIVFLVQTFNELIMQETNVFAAKTIEFLSGKEVYKAPQVILAEAAKVRTERIEQDDSQLQYGELLVPLIWDVDAVMQYSIYHLDEMKAVVDREYGEFGIPAKLRPGKYRVVLDDNNQVQIEVDVKPRLRSVIEPIWGELIVKIVDESQARVRMGYDLYIKNIDEEGFRHINQNYSRSDEEVGEQDKIWVLEPGNYMVKLGGGSWNDYKDFTTVDVTEGKRKILTMVVNPQGERNVLIGAGVLGDDVLEDRLRIHRGAIHTNVSLTSNNSVDKDKPTRSFSMSGQFDNKVEFHLLKFHYTLRSLYDLGMNISTGTDFNINVDDYSFRNTILLLPFEKKRFVSNLGLYGRADLNSHFFDEYSYFSSDRNLILIDAVGDTISILPNQSSLRTKIALFPMRLREGTGVTYRVVFSPNVSLSLRGGYGWQQEYKQLSYILDRSNISYNGLNYDAYKQEADLITSGYESTLIFSALNVFNAFSMTSTLDVLFPRDTDDKEPKFVSENRFNIRLFRNVSLDVKADIKYDKANKEYITYDYSSFLRLSLYY